MYLKTLSENSCSLISIIYNEIIKADKALYVNMN